MREETPDSGWDITRLADKQPQISHLNWQIDHLCLFLFSTRTSINGRADINTNTRDYKRRW